MKNLSYLLIAFLLLSFQESETSIEKAQPAADKEAILSYYKETTTELEQQIKGLSEDQMHFKASADSWSVSQCLEHIIATEKMLFQMAQELLEQPENVERKQEVMATDEDLLKGVTDRSQKFDAPKELQPTGLYDSPDKALDDFKAQREIMKDYVKNYDGNFQNHITDSPAGPVDGQQSLLFLAGHTARHTNQIEEIKSSEDFPSN